MLAGCTDKLISLLNDSSLDDAFVIKALRRSIRDVHGIDWNDPFGRNRLDRLLRFVNLRLYRGGAKSSISTAVSAWRITRDPDETILLCSGAEDRAISFVKQIRKVILSDPYRELFPERIPSDIATSLTEKRITLRGRTNSSPQASIEAWGYDSNNIGAHYDRFVLDDLVGPSNCSPVELVRVHKYLADMVGFFTPGISRPITRTHIGTRYDEQDDSWALEGNPSCLSLIVPIESYEGAVEDVSVRGVPTNPEWHGVEEIQERFDAIVTDPAEGPASWRRNFLLDPSAGGGRIFPAALVDGADWTPWVDPKSKRTWVSRVERDPKTRAPQIDKVSGEPKWNRYDPLTLYTVLGVDQSFADDGDEWAVSAVSSDNKGFKYQLETRTGHGFDAMWDTIDLMALLYRPRRIGLEKGAAQETTIILKSREAKFARIRGLIEGVSHKNEPKVFRIINNVAEPLKMGRYLLNPKDFATKAEMKLYKGPSSRAKDNILDSLAIANVLILTPPSDGDWKQKWKRRPQGISWLDTPLS